MGEYIACLNLLCKSISVWSRVRAAFKMLLFIYIRIIINKKSKFIIGLVIWFVGAKSEWYGPSQRSSTQRRNFQNKSKGLQQMLTTIYVKVMKSTRLLANLAPRALSVNITCYKNSSQMAAIHWLRIYSLLGCCAGLPYSYVVCRACVTTTTDGNSRIFQL